MDIKTYVAEKKKQLASLIKEVGKTAHLVIIQANDDPASDTYIRGKLADCQEVGIKATHIKLTTDTSETELLNIVKKYNEDVSVNGIIVQMPLPKHINEETVKLAVDPRKDVDGFHPLSKFQTCTPKGIIDFLSDAGFDFVGKNAIVIGRSNIVGKPLAAMLLAKHANVVMLHSRTKKEDMDFYLAHADLICVAVGKKWLLNNQTLKKSAYVIDVGINRIDGVLYGDACPQLDVAFQTPVPGGVGLLTRFALISNVWEAANHGI